MDQPKTAIAGTGSQTAALGINGETPSSPFATNQVESWDGTSWTEIAETNSSLNFRGAAGTQTSALAFGGNAPPSGAVTDTEFWNGTSWTELNNLGTARSELGGSGSTIAALGASGTPTSTKSATEEWSVPEANKTITVS